MKRPKKVKIIRKEVMYTISEYTCPFCFVTIVGAGIGKNITRFKCKGCGNELIVKEEEKMDKMDQYELPNAFMDVMEKMKARIKELEDGIKKHRDTPDTFYRDCSSVLQFDHYEKDEKLYKLIEGSKDEIKEI